MPFRLLSGNRAWASWLEQPASSTNQILLIYSLCLSFNSLSAYLSDSGPPVLDSLLVTPFYFEMSAILTATSYCCHMTIFVFIYIIVASRLWKTNMFHKNLERVFWIANNNQDSSIKCCPIKCRRNTCPCRRWDILWILSILTHIAFQHRNVRRSS